MFAWHKRLDLRYLRSHLILARRFQKPGESHSIHRGIATDSPRDISWSLVQNPALWAFAIAQGRDGLAFLQAFRAMRRGFANGTFRYAVMAFQK